MHHQTVLPRLTLSAFLLLSCFSAAQRLDVLSQLVRYLPFTAAGVSSYESDCEY